MALRCDMSVAVCMAGRTSPGMFMVCCCTPAARQTQDMQVREARRRGLKWRLLFVKARSDFCFGVCSRFAVI